MIGVTVENGAVKYMDQIQDNMKEWISSAIQYVAIDYIPHAKQKFDQYFKGTGATKASISAWITKRDASRTIANWSVGANNRYGGIGNLIAIWIPTAKGYNKHNTANYGSRDFLHESFRMYTASAHVKDTVARIIQGKMDELQQKNK